jgi:hypothetical protein
MYSMKLALLWCVLSAIDLVSAATMGVYFDSVCTELSINFNVSTDGWWTVTNLNFKGLLLTQAGSGCKGMNLRPSLICYELPY